MLVNAEAFTQWRLTDEKSLFVRSDEIEARGEEALREVVVAVAQLIKMVEAITQLNLLAGYLILRLYI